MTAKLFLECAKQHKLKLEAAGLYKSEIKELFLPPEDESFIDDFTYYEFNPENWNAFNPLRKLLYDKWDEIKIPNYEVRFYIYDNQKYIFIFGDRDFYEISWYKDRGKTEKINMNGEPINLSDYLDLFTVIDFFNS